MLKFIQFIAIASAMSGALLAPAAPAQAYTTQQAIKLCNKTPDCTRTTGTKFTTIHIKDKVISCPLKKNGVCDIALKPSIATHGSTNLSVSGGYGGGNASGGGNGGGGGNNSSGGDKNNTSGVTGGAPTKMSPGGGGSGGTIQ